MQSFLPTLIRSAARLAAIGSAVAALALFSSPSLAAQRPPSSQPAVKHANAGTGASVGQDSKDKQAKPSEQRPSTSDGTRLWMEIYTGNDYSH